MMHFKPVVAVPGYELRGHVYDFFRNEGYFPLSLITGAVFKVNHLPTIWSTTQHGLACCIFHHPQLSKWPVVTMKCDLRDNRLSFVVDEWKSTEWCRAQAVYANFDECVKVAPTMIAEDSMRHANMGC